MPSPSFRSDAFAAPPPARAGAGARVFLLDNYDSFTFNLADAFLTLGAEVEVQRNDAVTVADVRRRAPTHVVLSPGPGRPPQAGIAVALVRALAGVVPVLGVCLGHQAIVRAFGGRIVRGAPRHGLADRLAHDGKGLFAGLPQTFLAARYHSLIAAPEALPEVLMTTAWLEGNRSVIMGVAHRKLAHVYGWQFHPESFLTPIGPALLARFLGCRTRRKARASRGRLNGSGS